MRFRNREEAGQELATRLQSYQSKNPIVFALARGGVPIGYAIARSLKAPLEVMVARKIGAPGNPEFGIGAIAPGGVCVLNKEVIRLYGISDDYIQKTVAQETQEMDRRLQRYRGGRPMPDIQGKTVILVDDGLATGVTARAGIGSLRQLHPGKLLFAAPVCAYEMANRLRQEVDDLICLEIPVDFMAVGAWYTDFKQTTDEEVIGLLERNREERMAGTRQES